MGDSDDTSKKEDAPGWQQERSVDGPVEPKIEPATLEQAKKFLEDDEIREAPISKKILFLQSKGLADEDIQNLLGAGGSTAENGTSNITPTPNEQKTPTQQPGPTAKHIFSPAPSPPVITYPEFLTKAAHPKPLVTKPRLLTIIYIFSTLTLLFHGTYRYLITPMLSSLTTSRLSLALTARDNLERLVSRLEGMVSEIPSTPSHGAHTHSKVEESGMEEDNEEDPTEMFHRDIGVQTESPSTPTSRSGSSLPQSQIENQATRLASLKSNIASMVEVSSSEGSDQQELETTIGILREYCDSLAYIPAAYNYGGYGAAKEEKDDEIAKVKAGIRGVKGVLLSARSFPGSIRTGIR